jgi:hypothetical protein
MDWANRKNDIQKRFFRDGLYSKLDITYTFVMVSWTFNFLDFGMHHNLSGKNLFIEGDSGHFLVDGNEATSEEHAMQMVFGGHYDAFLEDFYSQICFHG